MAFWLRAHERSVGARVRREDHLATIAGGSPMPANFDDSENLDLIWGATAIAKELRTETRRAYHLLERRRVPGAMKIGALWVLSRRLHREGIRKLASDGGAK